MQNFHVGHVYVMLFLSISFMLSSQRNAVFSGIWALLVFTIQRLEAKIHNTIVLVIFVDL